MTSTLSTDRAAFPETTVSRLGAGVSRLWRILRPVAHVVPTVLAIITLNFFLLRLAPGDAADAAAAEQGAATAETIAQLRHHLGLDIPVLSQFLAYLNRLAHFDLGYSLRFNAPVVDIIASRLPATLVLMGASYLLSLVLGVAFGAVMATWRNRWPDRLLNAMCVVLFSIPSFCVGIVLVLLFSVILGWLPSDGAASLDSSLAGGDWLADRASHLIAPALALATHGIAVYARLTRATMIEVSRLDFVRTARAKGVAPVWVVVRHVLRNALIPVSTLAGLQLGALLGGAATVEMVFSWPGAGRLALEAVQARDYQTLLGVLLLSSIVVVAANVAVDVLLLVLDPRARRRHVDGLRERAA